MANPLVYYRMGPGAEPKRDPCFPVRDMDWRRDLESIRRFYARFTDAALDPETFSPDVGNPLAILEKEDIVGFAIPLSFRAGETEIGGVATLPECRNRGICKALIAEMAFRILAQGRTATLTTHRDNLPMRAAAEAIGMEPAPRDAE